MHQATALPPIRRFGRPTRQQRSLGLLAALILAAGAWFALSTSQMLSSPSATISAPSHNRIFADEAAFVPTASDYATLQVDEAYLPLPVAPVRPSNTVALPRRFANEAASVLAVSDYTAIAWGDNYLLSAAAQPAQGSPGIAAQHVGFPNGQRMFADEALTPLSAQEYANLALGEDYLPLVPPTGAHRTSITRRFADETLASLSAQEYAKLTLGEDYLPSVSAAPARPTLIQRHFADEALAQLSAREYANLALSDDYLPLVSPTPGHRVSIPRHFVDELIDGEGVVLAPLGIEGTVGEPLTPRIGPR